MSQRAINGDYIYFVTANVKDRRWYFVTPEKAEMLGQAIQTSCQLKRFELLAYCILPNHMHLLVRKGADRTLESVRCQGEEAQSTFLFPHRRLSSRRHNDYQRFTLSQLMQSIKGTFSRTLLPGPFWQHRSNFHIIESEKYLANVVDYIRFNYTKMNLPDSYGKPPFVFFDDGKISTSA